MRIRGGWCPRRGPKGEGTSKFEEFVWCFSENEEVEDHRVELGLRRQCWRMLRLKCCCGEEVRDLGFRESVIGFKEEEKDASFFVGVIGNIISILMFLSPVPTFWKIKKQGSTEDFSSLPYICTLLNCSLWTYYGIIKAREYLVATVNGFGIVVETIYVILFLIYAPKGRRVCRTAILAVILDVAILAAAVITTQLAFQGKARSGAVGVMGAGLNIVMYFSPLSAMYEFVLAQNALPPLTTVHLCQRI
ncbi:hypothetical protein JHK82_042372 [Glycine max]|nr:hypothetical protein JHK82_042372 [Glycine max]KAG5116529.1 hypothetical protein JHK84_042642 [Glycine max]